MKRLPQPFRALTGKHINAVKIRYKKVGGLVRRIEPFAPNPTAWRPYLRRHWRALFAHGWRKLRFRLTGRNP